MFEDEIGFYCPHEDPWESVSLVCVLTGIHSHLMGREKVLVFLIILRFQVIFLIRSIFFNLLNK